jgi:prepilin-type N-terminal cleavage/methylation domain-containing protein
MPAIKKKDGGVTLIELMIVLVIAAFLVAGIYSLFITQHRSYAVQDQVAGVQQDARAALNIMARDIRMAGFVAGAGSGTGFTDGTATATINGFNFAVNPINSTTAPDTLTVVLGAEVLGEVLSVDGTKVKVTDDHSTPKDVDYYFKNSSGNPIDRKYYIAFDLQPGKLYHVSTVSDTDIIITNFPPGSKTLGGKTYGVKAITYSVSNGELLRNDNIGVAQPLAGDRINTVVEDLQFAYQVEGDAGWYNAPADFPAGKTESDIRMIRINITVRPAVQDATVQAATSETQFRQPALEDHNTNLSGPDGFRRRVYTTEVKVRNL